jgi:hypothetical protein
MAEDNEGLERAIFARRAEALGTMLETMELPSLEAVLAASRRVAPRATASPKATQGSSRGRVVAAVSLAAACMLAALSELPREAAPSRIVADPVASAPAPVPAPSIGLVEPEPAGECTMNESVAVPEEHACVASCPLDSPAPLSTPAVEDPECKAEDGCSMSP